MKRLISAKDVEDAAAKGESLLVDDNTIVTAQARDIARERGVLLQCAHEVAAEPAPAKAAEPAQPCRGAMSEQAAARLHAERREIGGVPWLVPSKTSLVFWRPSWASGRSRA